MPESETLSDEVKMIDDPMIKFHHGLLIHKLIDKHLSTSTVSTTTVTTTPTTTVAG